MDIELFKNKKVVIVDDEAISAMILLKRLKKYQVNAVIIESGDLFLKHVEKNQVDLLLLDILMPEMSGIDLLKKLREEYRPMELPAIMVTARTDTKDIVEALKVGANDYITKPINLDIALARIGTQLELAEYYKNSLRSQELESINCMVTTYNHEINNPLFIALGSLKDDISEMDNKKLWRAKKAMERISKIVKEIQGITQGKVNYSQYSDGKMLKINKK